MKDFIINALLWTLLTLMVLMAFVMLAATSYLIMYFSLWYIAIVPLIILVVIMDFMGCGQIISFILD
jgi:hypothetical protein